SRDKPAPFFLVAEVLLQERVQVVRVVEDAGVAVAEEIGLVTAAGVEENEGTGGGRLEGQRIPGTSAEGMGNHAGPAQGRAEGVPELPRVDRDTPPVPETGQPLQPGYPVGMHGRIEVAGHEDVEVPFCAGLVGFEEDPLTPREDAAANTLYALAHQRLDVAGLGEDKVAGRKTTAVVVPQQGAVRGQPDEGNRGRPQASGAAGVPQVRDDVITLPAFRKPRQDVRPRVAGPDGQVGVALRVEGQAGTGLALAVQVLFRESCRDGPKEVAQGHDVSSRGHLRTNPSGRSK